MKEPALVIIKPDGISKGLIGNVFNKLAQANLEIIAVKISKTTRKLAEEHYKHLKNESFFEETINYLMGKYHLRKKLLAIIYYGNNAIKKCRDIAGATNPEEAENFTIRGSYGRINTKGIFENVVHVSSDKNEARREIQLWFKPDEITSKLYPYKLIEVKSHKERIWA